MPTHAESRQRLKVTIRPNATQTPIKESLSPLFPDLAAEYNKAAGIGRLIEELGANRKAKSIDEQWRRPRGFLVADLNSRITSILMRDTQEMEAVPLVDQIEVPETGGPRVKAEALRFVLNQLPLPTELTPWEAVLEFREDLDAKERLQRFQFWMRRKTKDGIELNDLKDEIEEGLFEYESYMRVHHHKMKAGKLELLLTVSAEVIEGLAKFQLSKAVQTLFSLRKTDLTLLEAELKAPGRELAFVVQARETFGA